MEEYYKITITVEELKEAFRNLEKLETKEKSVSVEEINTFNREQLNKLPKEFCVVKWKELS